MKELPIIACGEKSKLIIPSKTNFQNIDFFVYIPSEKFISTPTEFGLKTLMIDIKTKDNHLFVCQAKKDFVYASSIFPEVCNDWKGSKKQIQELIKDINLYFILVNNDYRSGDTGKQVSTFDKFDPEKQVGKSGELDYSEKKGDKKENKGKKEQKEKKDKKEKKVEDDIFVLFADTLNRKYFYGNE